MAGGTVVAPAILPENRRRGRTRNCFAASEYRLGLFPIFRTREPNSWRYIICKFWCKSERIRAMSNRIPKPGNSSLTIFAVITIFCRGHLFTSAVVASAARCTSADAHARYASGTGAKIVAGDRQERAAARRETCQADRRRARFHVNRHDTCISTFPAEAIRGGSKRGEGDCHDRSGQC